jgi:hypothetical protein
MVKNSLVNIGEYGTPALHDDRGCFTNLGEFIGSVGIVGAAP